MTTTLPTSQRIWGGGRALKRLFDVLFSILALFVAAPVMLISTIAIKLHSPGPVVFKQARIGLNGRRFNCLKFRTLDGVDHDAEGPVLNAPKPSWLGRFIRLMDVDEVPQFINVLKGDMSVVGPRPHTPGDTEKFSMMVSGYAARHVRKPGITGWAQVNGWRGFVDTPEKIIKRTEFDLWYIENWSFALDLKIIFLTVFSKKARAAD